MTDTQVRQARMDAASHRILGTVLLALSAFSVLQTAREVVLYEVGERANTERDIMARTFTFGAHSFSVTDDQPNDSLHSYHETEGQLQLLLDGAPFWTPSRAGVRRSLRDLGRYHTWLDAWVFYDRATGDSALYVARRLQPRDSDSPRFELVTVDTRGTVQRRTLALRQLGWDYRETRSTQFLCDYGCSVFPGSLDSIVGFFPILLLIFPIGSTIIGVWLILSASRFAKALPST